MKYELKLAAIRGEIVPLNAVAEAMALRDATAGGTPYHEPTFKGRRSAYIFDLLAEVRSGHLKVCDETGNLFAVNETIKATGHSGFALQSVNKPDWDKFRTENPLHADDTWHLSRMDLSLVENDKDNPDIYWLVTLKMLNEWAEKRGHSFAISTDGVGWYDERGYVLPSNQDTAQDGNDPQSKPNTTTAELTSNGWRVSARRIGKKMVKRYKNLNLDKISQKVHEEMLEEHKVGTPGMTGRSGIVPSAESIKRHALTGIKNPSR